LGDHAEGADACVRANRGKADAGGIKSAARASFTYKPDRRNLNRIQQQLLALCNEAISGK
jgi:hypothetical protein